MKFLLIGGQQNTGKSEAMGRLFTLLAQSYTSISNVHPQTSLPPTNPFEDFSAILKGVDNTGRQVKILIHSPTDDLANINLLEGNIKTHMPDIIICSIRDIHWQRQYVFNVIGENFVFEIPLARITRRGVNFAQALVWYQNTIDSVINSCLTQAPFNLI